MMGVYSDGPFRGLEAELSTETFEPLRAYREMAQIRLFEETCLELASEGLIAGSVHVCAGQEAIPVGAVAALGSRARIVATYRGHGWALACGVPVQELLAEVCHRDGGLNGGRGGSAHLMAPRYGLIGENSIVGAGVPIAAGLALAAVAQDSDDVVVVSIGDGAMNQGAVHEGLAFLAARSLPAIVICEHNGWSELTPTDTMVRGPISDRVAAYGIRSIVVDGCDPMAVADAVADAEQHVSTGAPAFLQCRTVRLHGHYNRDIEHYRSKQDRAEAAAREPLGVTRRAILDAGTATAAELDGVDAELREEMDAAVAAVRAMPEPDAATAGLHVLATPGAAAADDAGPGDRVELTYQKAVNAALRQELADRSDVLVYGEDVGVAGGIFGITRGLQEEFGAERVFDTPIAESAILGSAVGAALAGMRPVVEIMWGDFLLVALDQLINQAANVRYVSRGELHAPLVVRTQQGVTPGSCAQHSQSLEALLAHIPGLKVGLPATPDDAYSMLRAAIADPDPCVLFESRAFYQQKGPVQLDRPGGVAAGARFRRRGSDAAIITWGTMLPTAMNAAEHLEARGVSVSVLDLRWLQPLDVESIAEAVAESSGRVLVVHEATLTGGFGAEIAAYVQGAHFDELDGPVERVATPDFRIPAAPSLQRFMLPSAESIVERCLQLAPGASTP